MNRFIITLAASAFLLTTTASNVFAQTEPTKVGVTYSKVFVPVGFDNNDHVQIVGEGTFKNACYRPAGTDVKIDSETMTITLGPVAYEYKGMCLQVILPFERVIDIGVLKHGTWKIVQGTDAKVIAEIPVKLTMSFAPDDFLYAPVSQAFLRQTGSRTMVYITGQFSNSCMTLAKVDVSLSSDTVVVQPIAAMAERADCKDGAFPFSKSVAVTGLKAGRYLLHVRSMNGNAANQLVNIQ